MPIFNSLSGTATMAFGVASEPVPAVVGMKQVVTVFFPRSGSSRRSFTVYSSVARMLASFAVSIALPPPTARMMSAPSVRNASTSACTAP